MRGRGVGEAPADDGWPTLAGIADEGLALLDTDNRFEFASAQTAIALGASSGELHGRHLDELLPGLTPTDRKKIAAAITSDTPTWLMCTRRADDGWIHALRLTFVPRHDDEGAPTGLIMLSHDITPIRVFQDQRRRAQHRLTVVEDEEQDRIRNAVHDGPIQILAALALRLGTTIGHGVDPDDLRELEHAVESAGRDLRTILSAPTGRDPDTPAELLRRWAAPLTDGTVIQLDIRDRSTQPPNRATAEALFVFLYEAIKGSLAVPAPRTITAVLTSERAGFRLVVSVPDGAAGPAERALRARAGELRQYATLLGGSFDFAVTAPGVHTISALLPPLDEQGWSADPSAAPPAPDGTDDAGVGDRADDHPSITLSSADRQAIVQASYQGLMELDGDLQVAFVNGSYAQAFGRPAAQLVGRPFEQLFAHDDYQRLQPHVEQVRNGDAVRFEWRRRNAVGEPRWTQVAGTPRLDEQGRFQGALLTTLDTTDLHLAEDFRDAVLSDLATARRAARRSTARRLDRGPIQRLETVNDRLLRLIGDVGQGDAIRLIQRELERSIAELRSWVDLLADPSLSGTPWDDVLRAQLSAHLDTTALDLQITVHAVNHPSSEQADALIRIASEAVTDAVRQRDADVIEVELDEIGDSYLLRISDSRVGVEPSTSGAVGGPGTRSMSEHAAEQHGHFRSEPRVGGGMIVTVSIPRTDDSIVAI